MAEKAVANKTRVWEDSDWLHLLAWLDFCLEHGVSFRDTVVERLGVTTKKTYTWTQICRKLEYLWRNFGRQGCDPKDVIYIEGSKCLECLSDEDQETISEIISHIGLPSTVSSPLSSPPSTARGEYFPESELQKPDPVWPIANSSEANAGQLAEATHRPSHGAVLPLHGGSSGAALSVPSQNIGALTPWPAESRESLPNKRLEQDLKEKERQLAEKDSKIAAQESRIFSLATQLASLSKEHDELRHCIRAAGAHQRDPALLEKLQYENSILMGRLATLQRIQKDADSVEDNSLGRVESEVRGELRIIERRIAEACSSLGNWDSPLVNIEVEKSTSAYLESLVTRVCGRGIDQIQQFALDASIQKLDFLQSIAAASICISAFESDFPEFLGMDFLLGKYREVILAQGGTTALRNMDLLAHKSLVSEPYFDSDVVMARSKELATLLSTTLAPFLTPNPPATGANPGNPSNTHESEQDIFESGFFTVIPATESFPESFAQALRLKSSLFLSEKQYQLFFPQPGDAIDAETMSESGRDFEAHQYKRRRRWSKGEKSQALSHTNAQVGRKRVKLCLFPGLRSWPRKAGDGDWAMRLGAEEIVVNYRNFSARGEPSSTHDPELVAKAIVLVTA